MSELNYTISALEFHDFLGEEEIDVFFHANTLLTSCTYMGHDKLMSRKYVEDNGYAQTMQKSDEEDKAFMIWDDIFLDSVDICDRSGRPNEYGPILFKLSKDILLDPEVVSVKITKTNPIYWQVIEKENWYLDKNSYREKFSEGTFVQMITLQTRAGFIRLEKYLTEILIDSFTLTLIEPQINTYSYSVGAILKSIKSRENYAFDFSSRNATHLVTYYNTLSEQEILKKFKLSK